jgi:hypothetical protein
VAFFQKDIQRVGAWASKKGSDQTVATTGGKRVLNCCFLCPNTLSSTLDHTFTKDMTFVGRL